MAARLLFLCLLWLLAPPPAAAATIEVQGHERDYRLRLPDVLPEGMERPPLILALHGGGGSGRQIERSSGLTEAALAAGFAVAYPDAWEGHWNDGRGDPFAESVADDMDDVAFLLALVDRLAAEGRIDPDRVFLIGVSNGGMMSLRLACEAPQRFAGAVTIVASLPAPLGESCRPSVPLPLMMLNGTADPLVHYEGGPVTIPGGKTRGAVLPVETTLALFAAANGCAGSRLEQPADPAPDDGIGVERLVYLDCGAPTLLWRYLGGGHGWPGADQRLGRRLVGTVPEAPAATPLALSFFAGLPPRYH